MSSSHEPPCQWNQAPVTLNSGKINWGWGDGGKRMIQRLNQESGHQEMLYKAHRDDANKADHTWATTLTADRQHMPVLLVNNCVKVHLTKFNNWEVVPAMSRGFHFWQSQSLDMPPWLLNPRLPAMSPHTMPEGRPSWTPSLERRASWLGDAWAPIRQSRRYPRTLSMWKPRKTKQKPSAKSGTQIQKTTSK